MGYTSYRGRQQKDRFLVCPCKECDGWEWCSSGKKLCRHCYMPLGTHKQPMRQQRRDKSPAAPEQSIDAMLQMLMDTLQNAAANAGQMDAKEVVQQMRNKLQPQVEQSDRAKSAEANSKLQKALREKEETEKRMHNLKKEIHEKQASLDKHIQKYADASKANAEAVEAAKAASVEAKRMADKATAQAGPHVDS